MSASLTTDAGEALVGWRGNWTGNFQDAKPPVHWGRIAELMSGLRCQAEKPKGDAASGDAMPHGCITQWLVLGPFPTKGGKSVLDTTLIENESAVKPDAGEAAKGGTWKKASGSGSVLDIAQLFGATAKDSENQLALAHTYIYSEQSGELLLSANYSGVATRIYFNGAPCTFKTGNRTVALESQVRVEKGWNRLLCKVAPPPKRLSMNTYPTSWAVDVSFRAVDATKATQSNIVWSARLPERAYAGTLVVGDRIFVMAEPGDLICLNKQDGKPLWAQSLTYFDVLDEKGKADHPEIAALRQKLDAWNGAWLQSGELAEKSKSERYKLHWEIADKMSAIDKKKYALFDGRNQRKCTPTPVCDGRNVYIWLSCGIGACFDMDGKRKWNVATTLKSSGEHGSHPSPVVVAGKAIFPVAGELVAVDIASGKIAWQKSNEEADYYISKQLTPIPVQIEGKDIFVHGGVLIDPADGRAIGKVDQPCSLGLATPVLVDGRLHCIARKSEWFVLELPTDLTGSPNMKLGAKVEMSSIPRQIQHGYMPASPLIHERLVYAVNAQGRLFVVDTETKKLVYHQSLGLGREGSPLYFKGMCFNSPVLAGGHIYVSGVDGMTVVFKPGRQYQEVSRNRIEASAFCAPYARRSQCWQTETFTSTPVVDGDRLYLRGTEYLYCIGKM